jgi:hypothetical protein
VRRRVAAAGVVVLLTGMLFVADQARRTLQALDAIERERDLWQRADDVLDPLQLRPGRPSWTSAAAPATSR